MNDAPSDMSMPKIANNLNEYLNEQVQKTVQKPSQRFQLPRYFRALPKNLRLAIY